MLEEIFLKVPSYHLASLSKPVYKNEKKERNNEQSFVVTSLI